MTTRYFNVKQGITTGNITLDAASANITGVGNISVVGTAIANFFSGDGYRLSNITGSNVTGQVGNALVAGTVYTAAQPNITSVGTLSGLTVSGLTSLGPASNVSITGGSNGYILSTDGTGNLSWVNAASQGVSGSNTQVQFNNNGAFGASAAFTFDTSSNILTITGNIVSNNANLGNLATANFFTGTLTTAAQPNITSVGTLTSLDVTGNVVAGNVYANSGTIGASLLTGTLTTASQPNVTSVGTLSNLTISGTGSVSGANLVSANYITGTLTTNAQPNITSVGTLTSLDVSGNVLAANITANVNITATGNLSGNNATITNTLTAANLIANALNATGTADLELNSGTGNANVVLKPTGTGTVDVSNKRITQVATPSADSDAANKGYVDSVAQGLDVKASVRAATSTALPAVTYNNGTSGVGATLTADANGALTAIDGVTLVAGDRVLVKNQATQTQNGIYVVTNAGSAGAPFVLTRATDFDQGSPSGEIPAGFTFVEEGTAYADTGWVCTTNAPVTVGTTNITFSQFSGAGQYTAGDGLDLTGTTFSVNVDNDTIDISADSLRVKPGANFVTPNIGVASGTSLNVTGNVTGGNLTTLGDVSGNTGTFTSTVTAGNVYANSGTIGANLLTGTLTTAAQPNITSVGTLSGLTVNGVTNLGPQSNVKITGGTNGYVLSTDGTGNLSWVNAASQGVAGSNTQIQFNNSGSFGASANLVFDTTTKTLTTDFVAADGYKLSNIAGANVTGQVGNALIAGTVYTNAQPNITSVGSLTGLVVSNASGVVDFTTTANVTLGSISNLHISGGTSGQYLKTDGSGGLSFGTVDTDTLANGTSNVDIATSNGNVTVGVGGTANVAVFSTGGLDVTGNITATANLTVANGNLGNLATANYFSGNGSSLSSLTGANVTGQVGNALVAGTVYSNAQPNITSVGTLTSLAVTGNVTAGNVALNGGLTSNRSNVAVNNTPTLIDYFTPGTFRTAKYIISASGDDGYQSVETLLVHDGVNAYITIYGSICSNVSADIIDISSNINGISGNVSLYATSSSANAKVNIVASYINV